VSETAPFAYEGLDRVLHERARLGVLTSLAANPQGLVFADLKRLCGLTDGNLARHLQVLQEAGVVEVTKTNSRGRPQTRCRITPEGRRRFLDYLAVLGQVVREAAAATRAHGVEESAASDTALPGRLAPA
jgi:predicted ArsR family transcriptional regulator